jgi:hypothetical protein
MVKSWYSLKLARNIIQTMRFSELYNDISIYEIIYKK